MILSDVFGFICQVDQTKSQDEEETKTTIVYAHFIRVISSSETSLQGVKQRQRQRNEKKISITGGERAAEDGGEVNELESNSLVKAASTKLKEQSFSNVFHNEPRLEQQKSEENDVVSYELVPEQEIEE